MHAHARLRAERRHGRTRCTELRSAPPLTLRVTPEGVHLVGSAAGPLGGDALALDVHLAAGSELTIGTVAASLVLPGPHGRPSRARVHIRLDAGATLRWLPQPTVLAHGCDHEVITVIEVHPEASLLWRDVVVLARHREPTGSLLQRLRVDVGGRALLRTDLGVGPRWSGWDTPAVLGDARAVATVLAVAASVEELRPLAPRPDIRLAKLDLEREAALVTAVADDARAVAELLDGLA